MELADQVLDGAVTVSRDVAASIDARIAEIDALISSQLNPRVLAIACDALMNGLLIDIMAGMDKDEAKKIWIAAVTRLTE